jgi:hypothetical protein
MPCHVDLDCSSLRLNVTLEKVRSSSTASSSTAHQHQCNAGGLDVGMVEVSASLLLMRRHSRVDGWRDGGGRANFTSDAPP